MASYRVYFNRKAEAPQVWSFDEGEQTTETNVIGIETHGPSLKSEYFPGVRVNPDTPSALFHIERARVHMIHGVAHFYREDGDDYL